MQYFDTRSKVLVCRNSSYSINDLEIEVDIDDSFKVENCNIGWTNLSSLLLCDKVLLYDSEVKSFIWKRIKDIKIRNRAINLIELNGVYNIGGSGNLDEISACKIVSGDTECIYSFDNNDKIVACTANDLLDIAKKEFYTPAGKTERKIWVYTFDKDIDTHNKVKAPRKVRLIWENCKQYGVELRNVISVNIENKFVLLTKINDKSMF